MSIRRPQRGYWSFRHDGAGVHLFKNAVRYSVSACADLNSATRVLRGRCVSSGQAARARAAFASFLAARLRVGFGCGTTERRRPIVLRTARRVLSVGLPLGESER